MHTYRGQIVCGQTFGGSGGGPGQDVFSSSRTSSLDADDVIDSEMEGLGMGGPDIAKIKKVQSFFRGWLCRRRWKQIVDEYIRSPHAESMRKRNW